MITPDDLALMTEEEKVEFVRTIAESSDWQECFEPLYVRLMDDESPRVRQEAIAALWEIAEPRHIELLMEKAQRDPSIEVRAKAVSVLGIFIYEAVVNYELDQARYLAVRGFLLGIARDREEDLLIRRMAIEALSFDTDEEVQSLIAWAYQHDSVEMRMSALFAMGRSRSARWHDIILAEMRSEEERLRLEAINAAGEAQIVEATPRLRALTRDPSGEVRVAAIWALGRIRGPGALETLEMCAQSSDEETRRAALDALDEYHGEAGHEEEDIEETEDDD